MSSRLRLSWGGATHAGRVRAANQDALFADHGLFVVADGMGGHEGGEVASRIAVRAMSGLEHAQVEDLVQGVEGANAAVWDYAQKNPELMGMGTTVTAIAVIGTGEEPRLALVNVGDSRVYQWREGVLTQLTEDHSYVAELVRRGQLEPGEAETHPYRNMLTRAIGVGEEVEVDSWELEPQPGDRYLLCSDGLVNEVNDSVIGSIIASNDDPSEVAKLLIEQANASGGRDNITVVLVNIDAEPLTTAAATDTDQEVEAEADTAPNSLDTGVFVPVSGAEPTVELALGEDASDADSEVAVDGEVAVEGEVAFDEATLPVEGSDPDTVDVAESEFVEQAQPAPGIVDTAPDLFAQPVDESDRPIVPERSNPLEAFELPEHDGGGPLPWSDKPVAPLPAEPEPEPVVEAAPTADSEAARTEVIAAAGADQPVRFESPDKSETIGSDESRSGWSAPVAITWRHLAAVFLAFAIIAGAIGLTGWYARSAYHVGFAGDEVVVFQGREGGVFWFEPTLEEGSGIFRSQLPEATVAEIEGVVEVSSLEAARAFIEGVRPTGQ